MTSENGTQKLVDADGNIHVLKNAVSLALMPIQKKPIRESDKQCPWPRLVRDLRRYTWTPEEWLSSLAGLRNEDKVLALIKPKLPGTISEYAR